MSLFSFGPVTGFMLATLCLKFPENLLSGGHPKVFQNYVKCFRLLSNYCFISK